MRDSSASTPPVALPADSSFGPLPLRTDSSHKPYTFQTSETLRDLRTSRQSPKVAVTDALRVAGGVTIYDADGVPILYHIPNALGIALGDDQLGLEHAHAVGEEALRIMQASRPLFVDFAGFCRLVRFS